MKVTRRQNEPSKDGAAPMAEQQRIRACVRASDWEPYLYDYAEGLADKETKTAVEAHIAECAYCRGALEDIRWMISALQTSVPEPKTDLSARVMDTIRTEEEENGRVIAETIDTRTGRVLSVPSRKNTVRRITRTIGSLAAALVLVVGMMYVLPHLMSESGASSGAHDIINAMQNGEESRFSDGVFVGTEQGSHAETEANAFGTVPGNKGSAATDTDLAVTEQPVILRIIGMTEAQLWEILSELTAADGSSVSVAETEDGYLVSPLHAFESVQALIRTKYPALGVEILRTERIPDSYKDDAFYIRTEP